MGIEVNSLVKRFGSVTACDDLLLTNLSGQLK